MTSSDCLVVDFGASAIRIGLSGQRSVTATADPYAHYYHDGDSGAPSSWQSTVDTCWSPHFDGVAATEHCSTVPLWSAALHCSTGTHPSRGNSEVSQGKRARETAEDEDAAPLADGSRAAPITLTSSSAGTLTTPSATPTTGCVDAHAAQQLPLRTASDQAHDERALFRRLATDIGALNTHRSIFAVVPEAVFASEAIATSWTDSVFADPTIPSLMFSRAAPCALFSAGLASAFVLDVSHSSASCTAVCEGVAMAKSRHVCPRGAAAASAFFGASIRNALSEHDGSFFGQDAAVSGTPSSSLAPLSCLSHGTPSSASVMYKHTFPASMRPGVVNVGPSFASMAVASMSSQLLMSRATVRTAVPHRLGTVLSLYNEKSSAGDDDAGAADPDAFVFEAAKTSDAVASMAKTKLTLPDGTVIVIGKESAMDAMEVFFTGHRDMSADAIAACGPVAAGTIAGCAVSDTIADAVCGAIDNARVAPELGLALALAVHGGPTRAAGFTGRLRNELQNKNSTFFGREFVTTADTNAVWAGASLAAAAVLSKAPGMWVTRAQLEEEGVGRAVCKLS